MKAFFEEVSFDDLTINEALIQAAKREELNNEVKTAQGDGDVFDEGRGKMPQSRSKEWIKHKIKEDRVNSWREQNHLPPIRMVNHNGVDYNVPVTRQSNAVTKAKETMSPEQFEVWMADYLAKGAALRENISNAREEQFRWGTGMKNFKAIQQRIAELEQLITAARI